LQFQEKEIMDCSLDFNLPLIAIGAPVQAYLPDVAKKLGLELNIPGNAEIANAIGAAEGNLVLYSFGIITSEAIPLSFLGWFLGNSVASGILGVIMLKFLSPLVMKTKTFCRGVWA
jgi:hypothetical protein